MPEALALHRTAADPVRGDAAEEAPLRSELFSTEQLAQHARSLAGWHRLDPRKGPDRLLPRLAENAAVLADTHALIAKGVRAGRRITPAAEWLLDNYYLVE